MLKNRQDLIDLRASCKKMYEAEKKKILVCAGTGCIAGGALDVYNKMKDALAAAGLPHTVELSEAAHKDNVGLKKCGCLGLCEMGVLIRIEPEGYFYVKVKPEDCEEIVRDTVIGGKFLERLAYKLDGVVYQTQENIPFYKNQLRLTLTHCGSIDVDHIKDYLAVGGYSAFEKALFEMNPDEVVEEVYQSGLRGRGGGGFPAGTKWRQVKRQKAEPKYIVCNGDEGDPGAFMDGSIMEGDPHSVLEGMLIAGLTCGAAEGYIYVRAEYPRAVSRLQAATQRANELGLLGKNILGTDFSFNIHINRGAGAFVCGEGSALTASIEGKRGFPRTKPPRTVEQGLFEKPTVLNNVETFANIPYIINNGAQWFRTIGTQTSSGTKAFSLTGNIQNTGLIEVPLGTTLSEIIFDIGGGVRDGKKFKAVQIGGPSGGCLTEEHLDMPLDFDSLAKVGAMIGSGGLVVLDDSNCMVSVAQFFMNFTQHESCGKCVPCREGTRRMLEILDRIVNGEGRDGDIELLLELADTITNTSLCGLGKSAAFPVVSTIKSFRDEYEAHIYEKRCPTGNCQKLKSIVIDPQLCKSCTKCVKVCPVDAINGKIKEPFVIDGEKCIKCAACISVCPFNAIKEV